MYCRNGASIYLPKPSNQYNLVDCEEPLTAASAVKQNSTIFQYRVNDTEESNCNRFLDTIRAIDAFRGMVTVMTPIGIVSGIKGLLLSYLHEAPNNVGAYIEYDQLTESMMKMSTRESGNDFWVKYRDGKRYVVRMKKAEFYDKEPRQMREGKYLVTGGTGGLGRAVIRHLDRKSNV